MEHLYYVLHYIWDVFGAKPQFQNLLILFTLIASFYFSSRASKHNREALNVDINFRALEMRRTIFLNLSNQLAVICELPNCDEDYYPGESESKVFEATYQDQGGQEPVENPMCLDYYDDINFVISIRNEALAVIDEATLFFPNSEKELLALSKQIMRLIKSWGFKNYNKNKKLIMKMRDTTLDSMKESLDLKQFPRLDFPN